MGMGPPRVGARNEAKPSPAATAPSTRRGEERGEAESRSHGAMSPSGRAARRREWADTQDVTRRPASAWLAVVSATGLALALAPASPATAAPTCAKLPGTPTARSSRATTTGTRESTGLPVDARSDDWLSVMEPTANLHPDFGPSFGAQPVPVRHPGHGRGRQATRVSTFDYADESDQVPYPIGLDAGSRAARRRGDRHAIVLDAACTLSSPRTPTAADVRWKPGSGAVLDLRSKRPAPPRLDVGRRRRAADPPRPAAYDEVAAGRIDHAIRFTRPVTRQAYIWPARHAGSTDGLPADGRALPAKAAVDIRLSPRGSRGAGR